MVTSSKTIILPNKDELEERLRQVDVEGYLEPTFYDKLCEYAAREVNPMGIVAMFVRVIDEYETEFPALIKTLLTRRIPQFIDALISDIEAAAEAKALFAELS